MAIKRQVIEDSEIRRQEEICARIFARVAAGGARPLALVMICLPLSFSAKAVPMMAQLSLSLPPEVK